MTKSIIARRKQMSKSILKCLFLYCCGVVLLTFIACTNQGDKKKEQPQPKETASETKKDSAGNISPEEQKRLQSFIKKRLGAQMPADANIQVKGFEQSPVEGLRKGQFVIESARGSGEVTFLISSDGRHLIIGDVASLESFENTPIEGFKTGKVPLGSQPIPVTISTDGQYIVLAEFIDTTVDPLKETMSKISLEDVPVKGAEDAKVTIVEYSDFQCPFCKRGADIIPQILKDYDGKVKIAYKQLPLPIHNWARDAAISSVCASKQGNDKFWEFHDLLFENQANLTAENAKEEINGFAKQIGLNTDEFNKCIDSPEVAQRVQNETEEARSIGVSSTPTFVVNGMIVPGANPQGLKSAIDVALSENQ
jgi:protein-disulfide isomerase